MMITIQLFAILRDRAGIARTTLELPIGSRVSDAANTLAEKWPSIKPYLSKVAFAVNERYVRPETELKIGDELALIPPVSGG